MFTIPDPVPLRLAADGALERLARRLRVLGYDTIVHRGARLAELLPVAMREGRVVVTASRRPAPRDSTARLLVVPREDLAAGVRAVVAAGPAGAPAFSRCPRCNGLLARRSPFEAHGEVPGRVIRQARGLRSCTVCGHWYWLGGHTTRLLAWTESALGHPPVLADGDGPASPPPDPATGG